MRAYTCLSSQRVTLPNDKSPGQDVSHVEGGLKTKGFFSHPDRPADLSPDVEREVGGFRLVNCCSSECDRKARLSGAIPPSPDRPCVCGR